ncbi:MAG TPA: hypothetical protein VHS07_02600, partial [Candidatus Binataceae bacterium]|nr:hypothetical protein [Candidatus Binataceae bacterium]
MTTSPSHNLHNLKNRFNFICSRGALSLLMTAIAISLTGCFAPFIPLAVQGVGMLGKMVGIGAEAGTMVKHGNDPHPEETEVYEQTKFDNSDFDSTSANNPANATKCNGIVMISPAIIEFRPDQNGITQWRELGLGGTGNAPRWTVVADAGGATGKVR